MNELAISPETMTKLALSGDVGGLNPTEKVQYYSALCQRVGLDPATQPFKLMKLQGKETFYLDRSGAQQLNRVHQISHAITSREFVNGCYVVTARASIGDRFTDSLGAVPTDGLKGEALANATMKAETKAKRRATLDLVGLGMLDETEVETIPTAQKVDPPHIPMPNHVQTPSQPALLPDTLSDTPKPTKPFYKEPTTLGDVTRCEVMFVDYKHVLSKPDAPKKWEAWFCKFEDASGAPIEAGTFDKKMMEKMDVLKGQHVEITYKPGKQAGKFELLTLDPMDEIRF